MDVSGGFRSKERQAKAKMAMKAALSSSSIPSPKSGSNRTGSSSNTAIRKGKETSESRKVEMRSEEKKEEPKMKKRRGGPEASSSSATAPVASSWKRVKLAEDIQFKEGGFFMLEELHFDPNNPNSDYDQLLLQIPKNPSHLDVEPVVDTNDSDLDEILNSDDDVPSKVPVQTQKKTKKSSAPSDPSPAASSSSSAASASSSYVPVAKAAKEPVKPKEKAKVAEKTEVVETSNHLEDEGGDDAVMDGMDEGEVEEAETVDNKLRSRHVFVPEDELEFVDLPAWLATYNLHKRILMALRDMGYTEPTPIQKAVMPVALGKRFDIVGASQTGSGKTLAFGIPVIQQILELQEKAHRMGTERDDSLKCLILSPTRELALQIVAHLEKITKHAYIKVVPVIGGISVTKQMRFLRKRPDVLVATPGRLWELISNGLFEESGQTMASLRWLIFDEADKMIEFGRFAELSNILRTVYNSRQRTSNSDPEFSSAPSLSDSAMDVDQDGSRNSGKSGEISSKVGKKSSNGPKTIQTFIFSATMMIGEEGRKNLKKVKNTVEKMKEKMRKERLEKQKKRKGKDASGAGSVNSDSDSMMEKLMDQIDFQREIEVVDIVKGQHKVANLEEAKICCLHEEKDYYLYYFLSKYGGKSIIFVNAISNIKRLLPLMVILRLNAFGMHANMEQHHRMKNLEKFVKSESGVLITTDVMSRGVDIPSVDHVIHYSIPTSAEIFIHRSGRTARAFATGLSLHIVDPEDRQRYNAIMQQIGSKSSSSSSSNNPDHPFEVPDFPISDYHLFNACKKRVKLAAELDSLSHEKQKKSADKQWLEQKAKDLDADIPDDLLSSDDERRTVNDARVKQKAYDNAKTKAKYAQIKAQLRDLLSKPLSVHPTSQSSHSNENLDQSDSTSQDPGKEVVQSSKTPKSPNQPSAASKPVPTQSKLVSLASSAYPTKMAGARLLFAKNSQSFQSPPSSASTTFQSKKKKQKDKKSASDSKMEVDGEEEKKISKSSPNGPSQDSDDEPMPSLVPDMSTHAFNVKKAPSAAFLDVQRQKGSKDAYFSSEMVKKQKEKRKMRMTAMGRQSVSGPLRTAKK
jgi:ATP-dependent RNA helicase DDX24/MAK5